jgi:small subunit ribosomal protein S2
MAKWIYAEKDDVHIFDLIKTVEQLKLAYNIAYALGKQGKSLVVVGTKKQARDIVKELCTAAHMQYIASRWLGGLLTNWEQVQKSLARMLHIEKGLQEGAFTQFTKYERVLLEKEKGRLERFFGGLRELKAKPDMLFVIDPGRESVAISEASRTGVPIIGMVDTNTDPDKVDVVIPANDDSEKSIRLIAEAVIAGYTAGRNAKA